MGKAWEVLTGRSLAPGAGPVALTNNTGDTFQIRSVSDATPALLHGMWGLSATAGLLQLRSPRLHDPVRGLRYALPAATVRDFFPDEAATQLYSQDILTYEIGGGGAGETDSAALHVYYPDLGGSDQRLGTWDQIKPMIAEMCTIEVVVVGPVVAGDWSPGTAINATNDLMKANADYAILGYVTGTAVTAVAIKGADTANLKVGGPGPVEPLETRDFFVSLSRASGLPAIPVINQANRAATLAHVVANAAAGTVTVDFIAARLSSRFS